MTARRVLTGLVLAFPFAPLGAQSITDALYGRITAQLASRESLLVDFRRDIHRHPEISGEEERTAKLVADRLRALGLEVRNGIGGHGVVGIVRGGKPGPLVAFRSDMDAVRSTEADPVEFRSVIPGVRHICGHDVHTTIGLALAEGLTAVRADLPGTVMLIFQPAEERATGARAMLADRVFGSTKPVAIFAVHTAPLNIGQLGTRAGGLMAGRDIVTVQLTGSGDLAAAADSVRRIVVSVGTLSLAQAVQPAPPTAVFAQARNPTKSSTGEWSLEGIVTTASAESRASARATILRALNGLSMPGVTVVPTYREKAIAGVTNDSALVSRANARIAAVLGSGAVVSFPGAPPAFSEDFGSFQDEVPGVMYFLGVSNPAKGWVGAPHTPGYVADEAAILIGAKAMTAAILDVLANRAPAQP